MSSSSKADLAGVLLAVDLSDHSVPALHWAVQYAETARVSLHVVHVAIPGDSGEGPEVWQEILQRTQLDNWLRKHGLRPAGGWGAAAPPESGPLATTSEVLSGDAAGQILRVATEKKTALIVIGSRRLGWLQRLTETSVSRAVLDDAPCPVVICRSPPP